MSNVYQLTTEPVLIPTGREGRATVRATVPFFVGSVLCCAAYVHAVDSGKRQAAVFRATDSSPAGIIQVWPSR
jgi:hypothetical protein